MKSLNLSWLAVSTAIFLSWAVLGRADSPQRGDFPSGFRWCVATSAHQVEGANSGSDWWRFEQEQGRIKNGDRSGLACDHWNRLEEDVRLIQSLNVGTYRFSVEWAKIEPAPGQFNEPAIEHYRQELDHLISAGIQPMVTLNHFTLPAWVADQGGWEWPEAPARFLDYTEFVYSRLGGRVVDWLTLNEPMVQMTNGYLTGLWPPGKKNDFEGMKLPVRHMLMAHAAAYHLIHDRAQASGRPARVGIAHHLAAFDAYRWWNPVDRAAAQLVEDAFNWALVTSLETGRVRIFLPGAVNVDETIPGLKQTQDYVGLNYYSRSLVKASPGAPGGIEILTREDAPKSDLGWEVYPEGIYRVLKKIQQKVPGKPVMITENGIADQADTQRAKFIEDHLAQTLRAINEGVLVEGYCHWSLMDNFEWAEGFWPRFGLYELDYATLERRPRASARRFAEIASRNSL